MTGQRIDDGAANLPHWVGHPHGLAPLSRLRPGGRFGDDLGRSHRLGFLRFGVEVLRHALFLVLDAAERLLVTLLAGLGRGVSLPLRPSGDGPLVLVLPVLPDLSHTFVYREVLALRARRRDVVVVALERGSSAVLHPEAAALLPETRFLPRRGVLGRLACMLGHALRHPRRVGNLARLYAGEPGGPAAVLCGKLPLREARHPGRAFELAALLAPLRPSEIHAYGSTWSANVALGAALLLEIPWSLSSYVDFEFDYAHRMLATKFATARFFRVCTRDCVRRLVDLLDLPEAAQERIPVIHWGVDAEALRQRPTPAPPFAAHASVRLISACRVVPKKGVQVVPNLVALLRARGIDAEWTLIGDGPELGAVRDAAKRARVVAHCHFAGPLPNDRVLDAIERSDVAILPCVEVEGGERDGIPVFLVEAMALGRLVVTTAVSGIPELVVDGVTGVLAAADPEALASAIAALVAGPERALAIAARGRERALIGEDCATAAAALLVRLGAVEGGAQTPN